MSSSSGKPLFAALDLGAESGRVLSGALRAGKLSIEEIHRFPNGGVQVGDHLHWDVLRLWSEIKLGLAKAVQAGGSELRSLGVDTWGVDFGLLDAHDHLIGNPYHYRDRLTDGMLEAAFQIVPKAEIYEITGIQFMQLNSLYQLLALVKGDEPAIHMARSFLTMPDLFNFWLSGEKVNEFTNATTTQCYDPRRRAWAVPMLERLGIPTVMFQQIIPPGSRLGDLRPSVLSEIGFSRSPSLIAVATHDTGSAVAAVPASGEDYIYLSSGTWSLLGVEVRQPVITPHSLAVEMTNEGGVEGTFRFLKNVIGLWLVQECRRQWGRESSSFSYDELTQMAAESPPFRTVIYPSDARFLPPGDMPARIQAYCQEKGQPVPQTRGEIVRCVLESLALEYRWLADQLDQLVGRRLPTIHIFGGGSKNRLLNQFAADATRRRVISGPVEATAIGNILVQAIAMGEIASLAEGRAIVRQSFAVETFEPAEEAPEAWEEAYQRYLQLRA